MASERARPGRELVIYFGLAYAITWGLTGAYLASLGFDVSDFGITEALVIFGCMILGPSVAGLGLTAVFEGRAGLSAMVGRLRRWRQPAAVWAVALATNPVVLVAVLAGLSLMVAPRYAPGFLPMGIVIGIIAGAVEELGWTGYATPRLLGRLSPVRAGLVLGLLWASWHGLADFAGNIGAMSAGEWVVRFAVYWLVPLTAYRVLMTWLYSRTGSLLVAMAAHASYTGWQATLTPAATMTPGESLVWYAAFAVAISIAVAIVIRVGRPIVAEDGASATSRVGEPGRAVSGLSR